MKLNAVVRQHDADLVGAAIRASRKAAAEVRPTDRDVEIRLAFGPLHFGDVDVEVADRIGLERLLGRFVALPPGATG